MFNLKGVKIKHYISSFVLMMITFFIIGYLHLLNSDAYKFAKNFLRNNPIVSQEIGSIDSIRPGLLDSEIEYGGGTASAKIHVILSGKEKAAEANLVLSNAGSSWVVDAGTLLVEDEKSVSLIP